MRESKRVQFVCPPKLLAYLNHQATEFCRGNRSEYLRHLILTDMRSAPDPHIKRITILKERKPEIPILGYGAEHANILNELKINPLFQKQKKEVTEKVC